MSDTYLNKQYIIKELGEGILKLEKSSENSNILYQNLQDLPKAVLSDMFITTGAHIQKVIEISHK